MKSPKWVATTWQLIKSNYGFGWSISGWERNNKLITKVVYRYQDGSRNSILVDLIWTSENSGKMINLIEELADLMEERNVDLAKAYELVNGGKMTDENYKKKNWEYQFLNRNKICSNSKFNVYFDHLITTNNSEVKDFLIVKPRVSKQYNLVGICVLPLFENKYCLMKGWRHQFNKVIYQAPAGFVEPEESPEETAIRELKEETALICSSKDLISLGSYIPDAGLIEGKVALYLATKCIKSKIKLDKEIGTGKLVFFTKKDLLDLIQNETNIGGSTLVASFRALSKFK